MEAQSDLVSRVVPPLQVTRLLSLVPHLGFPLIASTRLHIVSHGLIQKRLPKQIQGAASQASGDNLLRPLTTLELRYHHKTVGRVRPRKRQALRSIFPAQGLAPYFTRFALGTLPAQAARPPLSPASLGLPRALPEMQPLLPCDTDGLSEVLPWHAYWIYTRIISDAQESRKSENLMSPSANLQLEPGRSPRESPWTTSAGPKGRCRLDSQSLCQGAQSAGPLRLPLPLEKQAALDRHFFVTIIFPVQQLQTVCMGFSTRFMSWYSLR